MSRTCRTAAVIALTAVLTLPACGGDSTRPDPPAAAMQRLAGSYTASESYGAVTFTSTGSGESTDWLARGGSLKIELAPDGTTTGRVFLPGADEDGGDWTADLKGSWSLDGTTVRFSHTADTFLRDTPFRATEGRLEGDQTFNGIRVHVVLLRR
jgi:hypothetical protein